MKYSIVLPILAAGALADQVSYEGYKLFRVATNANARTRSNLKNVVSDLTLDEWVPCTAESGHSDILVPGDQVEAFQARTAGLDRSVMLEDVGAAVADNLNFASYEKGSAADSWFDSYHPYADHLQYLKDLSAKYPNISRIVTAGKSYEGRDIQGIHIYGSRSGPGKKPAVVWHGNVHAREWITSMTVEFMTNRILSTERFLGRYDFYIFPIVNPDGFTYSQSTDRLWRKNRAPTPNARCPGTDINRNWNYKWNTPGGSSTNPCDQTYRGQSAGDSPENKALTKQINDVKAAQGVKQYVDWHSYSQLFMTSYGYTCTSYPDNDAELRSLAAGFATELKKSYNTTFTTGPICETIYAVSGGSTDYADAVTGVDYAFAAELRDTGTYGFLLPANQIRPSGIETWRGIRSVLQKMK